MKLIIDIPEDVYNGIKILEKAGGVKKDTQITIPMEALANGEVVEKEYKYMDNTKVGWDEYVDIKDALLNIFEAGYTKEMILTVLEQIEDEEIYLSQSVNNKQKIDHLEALKLAKTEQGGM